MNSFAVQMSYASVDRGDGADPRAEVREILTRLRVPAGLMDGDAPWQAEQQEAVVQIPMTDAGTVLTLTAEDTVETVLTGAELRAEFADAGLNLWLHGDGGCCDDEHLAEEDTASDLAVEADSEPVVYDAPPVRVSVFSHRGPFAGRALAQMYGVEVEHLESGSWSLLRFESEDPTSAGIASGAEMPVIELNRVDGGGDWFEVTTKGGAHHFWPDAERGTVPVLDLDAITVPETAEICRRLISDSSHEELVAVAAESRLDVVAAHRALQPEVLGGVAGEQARQAAFLAAFGIPTDLIDAALDEAGPATERLTRQRFTRLGWGAFVGESLIDGVSAMTPLTRRSRPLARLMQALRRRPMLAAALSVGELTVGVAASRRPGLARVVGILLMIDAVADLVIGTVRARRPR